MPKSSMWRRQQDPFTDEMARATPALGSSPIARSQRSYADPTIQIQRSRDGGRYRSFFAVASDYNILRVWLFAIGLLVVEMFSPVIAAGMRDGDS
jgi:hypothetical protein